MKKPFDKSSVRPSSRPYARTVTAPVGEPEHRRPADQDRVAKYIARAGLGSRRDIEAWILEGRVSVNGVVLTSPALNVSAKDTIVVDGKPLPARERTRLWLYHKPRGLVTTEWDPEGRPTVFEVLPPVLPRVVSVGRLDINTEGLLLLTNDGALAGLLENPRTGWSRRYRVRAFGKITQDDIDKLAAGMEVDGVQYGPIEAHIDREMGENVWLILSLTEGKNREIKNVLKALGLEVTRLIRVSYGPFQLLEMEEGAVEEVPLRILKEQISPRMAETVKLDFEGGVNDAPVRSNPNRADAKPRPPFKRDTRSTQGERPAFKATGKAARFAAAQAGETTEAPEFKTREFGERTPRGGNGKPRTGALSFTEPARAQRNGVEQKRRNYVRSEEPLRTPRPERNDTPRPPRDGDRPYSPRPPRDGDRPQYRGDSPRPPRDGDRPYSPRPPRDGDRPQYRSDSTRPPRDGDRPYSPRPPRDGDRPQYRGDSQRPTRDRNYMSKPPSDDTGAPQAPRPPREPNDRPSYGAQRGKPGGFSNGKPSFGGRPGSGAPRGGGFKGGAGGGRGR